MKKTLIFILIPAVLASILVGFYFYAKNKVETPKKENKIGANEQKTAMELCGAISCLDLASQGIDKNQWEILLGVLQTVEKQGYLSNLKGIQDGFVLKEKIDLLDELLSEQAKALPIKQTTSNENMLGGSGITLGDLLQKAKLANVIY